MSTNANRMIHLGQFRLTRLQVVNWGTFCGYKDFRVDERGVLLTGPSGSGKSSLLDAHSLVLLPTHDHRFNASADLTARGAKQSTRGVADYVRGAWSETNDEAERSRTRYLRAGKPTWSAVAGTYSDGLGSATTAVVVKWFAGVEADGVAPATMHQIHDGEFDLDELEGWAARRFDTRWFKQTARPHGLYPSGQQQYLREIAKRVGLGTSQTVLSLLGKAKAMKNVGDLNLFVRENMLDEPDTWAAADRALAAFVPLHNAYITAKRAREQEQVLHDLPAAWIAYCAAGETGQRAGALRGIAVDRYVRGWLLAEVDRELVALEAQIADLDAKLATAQEQGDQAHEHYQALSRELATKSKDITALEERRNAREAAAQTAQERYGRFCGFVEQLRQPRPTNEIEFAALRRRLPQLAADAAAEVTQLTPRAHEAIAAHVEASKALRAARAELERLESAPSLIASPALHRRKRISDAAGVPIQQLPYAAELIDLLDGEERWRPAAEKVLRSYGMRLLVPERHKDAVRRFIDDNDMRGLVDYSVVTAVSAHQPRPLPSTLAGKLTVDLNHPHGRWLAGQLAQKFQHACVESASELEAHRIAVTVRGTVKMPGNHYRKDDRPELTAPSAYILGADTARKRAALADELEHLDADTGDAEQTANDLSRQLDRARGRTEAAETATGFASWAMLDDETPSREAAELADQVQRLRAGNADLPRLERSCNAAKRRWEDMVKGCGQLERDLATVSERELHLGERQHEQRQQPHALEPDDHTYLVDLCLTQRIALRIDEEGDTRRRLDVALGHEVDIAQRDRNKAHTDIDHCIQRFLERWPDAAPDDTGDVERAGQDFVDLHADIIARRLPDAMAKFQQMISEDMVPSISLLVSRIDNAVNDIRNRINMVNTGLRRVEFDNGTHLQIAPTFEVSTELREFHDQVDEVMANAAHSKATPDASLAQFRRVQALMGRFTGSDTDARRWQNSVLDVRLNYSFYGREVDQDGQTRNTYRRTGTGSGGEQEKLVAFCLAAALSYNLADPDSDGRPKFAVLMLDEAFSKSDEVFAAQALAAFDEFGFQLIMAAPIRMSGIVEPFIGEAILVEKRKHGDEVRSSATVATFGELSERRRYSEDDGGDARASA